MKQHKYLVTYMVKQQDGSDLIGNIRINTSKRLKSDRLDRIKSEIVSHLTEVESDNIIILSIFYFGKEK